MTTSVRIIARNSQQLTHSTRDTTRRLLAAAAADRPNSSSSSTQQRRRRGSEGGQLRASEPPVVRSMTPCLSGCVWTYASARGVHTQVNKSLNTLHTAEATTAKRLFAAAAAATTAAAAAAYRPNSSRSRRPARTSDPPIDRLMTSCLGRALFGPVSYDLCCL